MAVIVGGDPNNPPVILSNPNQQSIVSGPAGTDLNTTGVLGNPYVPAGFIIINSSVHGFVTARLGQGSIIVSGSYGGWDPISRPRNDSLIEWRGHDPMTMALPILFDGLVDDSEQWGRGIESQISLLEVMARKIEQYGEPGLIALYGAVPHTEKNWVINDIVFGDDVRRPTDGHRVRAAITLTLVEYLPDDDIKDQSAARQRQKAVTPKTPQKKGATHKTYTVHQGDTLQKIAASQLGSSSRWHEIADLNGIRDGKSLKVGQKIKLP